MTTINILNLKCNGCANTIKKGLGSLEGIEVLEVNLENSYVKIDSIDESVIQNVKTKLASMGYPEVGDANTLIHKAKSVVSCASGRISK
jgi:copper chaperone CopZ